MSPSQREHSLGPIVIAALRAGVGMRRSSWTSPRTDVVDGQF